ncbi:cupin domain-containing protein [Nonomuraea sp. SYSU D8015]|uniref:cupin domain-containing protein n=1 Tax=Nonomuraea sp. SYSU D8015 TaxID=2593644 RepID=UPI001CB6CB88|nr:cupin domain-containing protein [Nonomuraea sp. SYSU D8015]
MRRSTLADMGGGVSLPGFRVASGGVSTLPPGQVSHASGRHTHPDPEIFLILSGTGKIHIDGEVSERPTPGPESGSLRDQRGPSERHHEYDFAAGDVLIVEAGEDHHLEAVSEVVTVWLHLEPV